MTEDDGVALMSTSHLISDDALETVEVEIDDAYACDEKARMLEELFEFWPHMFHEDKVKAKIAELRASARKVRQMRADAGALTSKPHFLKD